MSEDNLQDLEGRTITRTDVADAQRWKLYHGYFDLKAGEDPALAFHWLLFTDLPRDVRPDGHPVVMEPFPVLPFPRRMWAGGEVNWRRPVAEGAALTKTTVLSRAEVKSGGSGSFLLSSLQHSIDDGAGRCVDERQDIVFLPAESRPGSAPPKPPAFDPAWRVERSFGPVDLFRYSALTLNSHRIHYDAEYATTVEGYRGLVVHGPLLASTLMQAAARQRPGRRPAKLAYRAAAPVFLGEAVSFAGSGAEGVEDLAVIGPDGGVRMVGTMTYEG